MKDFIIGFLSKTLNMDSEQLAELLYQKSDEGEPTLKADALKLALGLDADRVAKLKPDTKGIFDNGYKKAEKEVAERWEAEIRKAFDISDDTIQGTALLDAVKTATASKQKDPADIKRSPEYLKLEREAKAALDAAKAEHQAAIEQMKAQHEKQSAWSVVQQDIRARLMKLNPVLPSDPTKQARVLDLFVKQLAEYEWQADNGTFIPMKDGKRVENGQGYPKSLDDIVHEYAEGMFEFQKQAPAGQAGNKNDGGKQTKAPITTAFKTEGEYLDAYAKETDPEAKKAMYDAWTAAAGAGG